MWACQLGSATSNYLSPTSIVVDDSFNVYTTGQFNTTIDFNPFAGTFNITAAGTWDIFIDKIGSPSPLPIELLSFDAAPNKNTIDITWATATETNNDFFTIEKSKDGNKFEDVAKVDGAGNSNQSYRIFFYR
ncbi:MAG: SBBP repeat-containing protein [Bacteroidetes bacterium]|nr:SBBP repeat-containing protein [Bacteroidota bacterium]